MDPAANSSVVEDDSALLLARIDGQEEELVFPLREYLESNGCRVITNTATSSPVSYHIATGDVRFVKSIFSITDTGSSRRLAIVLGTADQDDIDQLSAVCKIVLVDPRVLTAQDVLEIFTYFFAGNENVYDKRRNVHEPAPLAPVIAPQPTVFPNDEIQSRINGNQEKFQVEPFHATEESLDKISEEKSSEDRHRIGHIISDVFKDELSAGHETGMGARGKHRKRKMKRGFWITVSFFCFLIIVPVLWYVISLTITAASFAVEIKNLQNGNSTGASQFQNISQYWLHQSRFVFGFIAAPFRLTGADGFVRGQERLLSFFSDISAALNDTVSMSQSGREVATELLVSQSPGTTSTPAYAMSQLQLTVSSVIGTLGLAQAELTTLIRDATFPFSIPFIGGYGKKAEQSIVRLRDTLTYVGQMLTLYPQIAGYKEPRTYLLLLQNSSELRPTGGFIGSVGVLKFDTGSLTDLTIQDVYALDGQLKGHVDPPQPMKDLMGAEHWYLRDSNWDPDFQLSATRSAWFYEKESGSPVDGVIAVNVPFVTDLLKITGPVTLPDYNDQISADNFFGKSLYYTQHDFFPGSTQKSDFLGSLTRTLIMKITGDKNTNPISVFRAIASALIRKDIQIWLVNPDVQDLVSHYGWSGRMFSTPGCEGTERGFCFFDPLAVVEANLSVSKVNNFVKRSVARELMIAPDGSLTESYALTIKNTSNSVPVGETAGLGGAYTVYLRAYTSVSSTMNDITYDGVTVHSRDPTSKVNLTEPYIEISQAPPGLHSVGIAVSIPPGTEHTIRISLTAPQAIAFGRGGAVLDVLNYKHPGVSDETIRTVIRYPDYWKATDESVSARRTAGTIIEGGADRSQTIIAKNGQLEYNNTILEDQLIRIRFIK